MEFIIQNNASLFLSYLLIAISIVSFWLNIDKKFPVAFFATAWLVGLFANQISWVSILSLIILGTLIHLFYNRKFNRYIQTLLFLSIVCFSILLFLHKLPGFNNWKLLSDIKLSDNSSPFSFWLNFDKPIIGFLLLLIAYNPVKKGFKDIPFFHKNILLFFLTTFLIVLITGLGTSFLRLDPKIPDLWFLFLWIFKMLIFTAIVEELFFRFFIQNNLSTALSNIKYGKNISLVLTSILFGVFHFQAGFTFVIMATVAGFLYGLIYIRTKRLELAILLHFMINFIHLMLFSYPR